MTIDTQIWRLARSLAGRMTTLRHDLHQHPELGFQERRTAAKAREVLDGLGMTRVRAGVAGTGIVAELSGPAPARRVVALRADMDALPVTERSGAPHASQHPGVMHACGHDMHVAMLLGAAMILSRMRARIPGMVKFLFQPAEELLLRSGARALIRAGALRDPRPDAIFALHVNPNVPRGSIALSDGPVLAAADLFTVTVSGRGGHGAHPELCVDPIQVLHQVYAAIQGIERNLAGRHVRVISVCSMHAGTAFNIIPPTAELKGTVRTYDATVQETIIRRFRALTRGLAAAHGAAVRLRYVRGVPATCNDATMAALARATAAGLGIPVIPQARSMGSEDFSFYLRQVPGLFIDLGQGAGSNTVPLHNERFDGDDRVLPTGAALLARLALRALAQDPTAA